MLGHALPYATNSPNFHAKDVYILHLPSFPIIKVSLYAVLAFCMCILNISQRNLASLTL